MAETTMEDFTRVVGQTFCWHELYVPNGEEGVSFYTECLGFGSQSMDMGDGRSYNMLTKDGVAVCGIMHTAGVPQMEDVPPHWSIYVTVDDVDARLAKCTGMGGSVLVPPMDIPNIGRMALIKDPQGATFWLFKSATPA